MADAIDDGLIKASERLLAATDNHARDIAEPVFLDERTALREALSRHKAPLSDCDHFKMVSRDDGPWRCVKCGAIDPPRPKYGSPAPLSVAGDDVELHIRALKARLTRLEEIGDEVVDMTVAEAQAEYEAIEAALTVLQVTEGDKVERLRESIVELWHQSEMPGALHEALCMTWEEYQIWANSDARSQSNKVSKPL